MSKVKLDTLDLPCSSYNPSHSYKPNHKSSRSIEHQIDRIDLSYNLSNKEKGDLGQSFFTSSVEDVDVIEKTKLDKYNGDIDHLLVFDDTIIFEETKNVNEDLEIYWHWFKSHVLDRYDKGMDRAKEVGYERGIFKIGLVLTIPYFRTDDPRVLRAIEDYNIQIIETHRQALCKGDYRFWRSSIRGFLINLGLLKRSVKTKSRIKNIKNIIKRGINGFRLKDKLLEDNPSLKRILEWLRTRLRAITRMVIRLSSSIKVMMDILRDKTSEVIKMGLKRLKIIKQAKRMNLSIEDQEFLKEHFNHCHIFQKRKEEKKTCCRCNKVIGFGNIICTTNLKSGRTIYCKDCFGNIYIDLP